MTYQILSPDGIEIGNESYTSLKQARKAFKDWQARYKVQGYYSTNQWGRIPVEDLESYCEIIQN